MQNLIIDDGLKEFMINGDKNRVIRFNPADINLLERFDKAYKSIEEEQRRIEKDIELKTNGKPVEEQEDYEQALEVIRRLNQFIKDQIDYIFDSEVSDVIFGNQSPMSTVKGRPFFERVFDAIQPILEKEITAERKASEKRISKYTGQIK